MTTSTYYFIGKFEPYEECKDFYPGELDIGDGWILDICADLVCIWKSDVTEPFDKINPFVREAFAVNTALFILRTQILINYHVTNWIEAKDVKSARNIIGAFVSKRAHPRKNARVNVSWKKSARVFHQLMKHQLLRISLKDYIASLKDAGDDAFFYAYRSIENICRYTSGAKSQFTKSDWDIMHKSLGTTKTLIEPLTNAATDIRHGNINGSALSFARSNKKQLLDISKTVLIKAFKKNLSNFI